MSFSVKDVLRLQVAPALGCTEPVAVALAAAAAVSLLGLGPAEAAKAGLGLEVEVWVDPNVYKNGLAVTIPGTGGLCGLDTAAALGALGGDPTLGLEVLEPVGDVVVEAVKKMLRQGRVTLNLLSERRGLHIRAVARLGGRQAEAVVEGQHDAIVSLSLDGVAVTDSALLKGMGPGGSEVAELEAWLRELSLADLIALTDELDSEDMAFLEEGVRHNLRLAEHGLKTGCGMGVGKTLERLARQKLMARDMSLAARMLTSAAADARMDGVKLPAMSSAGSGNHGLTAVLPIWAVKDFLTCGHEDALRAIGLSHIVTASVKAHTGRLSAVCGCSVAAGAGATAGVAALLGGDLHHIAGAIKILIE
ncbi:MAG: L-serine ammonia-lyase, iron-sulfur-dependent, subunit alpha, partial [Humidesulfovibrio sp.]|nr:L-serine ammonia-lyase, iron-sulfur-dependent, subunit alpha [Humidesulfovibrio sp.]